MGQTLPRICRDGWAGAGPNGFQREQAFEKEYGPCRAYALVRGRSVVLVAGRGFEPLKLSRRFYRRRATLPLTSQNVVLGIADDAYSTRSPGEAQSIVRSGPIRRTASGSPA